MKNAISVSDGSSRTGPRTVELWLTQQEKLLWFWRKKNLVTFQKVLLHAAECNLLALVSLEHTSSPASHEHTSHHFCYFAETQRRELHKSCGYAAIAKVQLFVLPLSLVFILQTMSILLPLTANSQQSCPIRIRSASPNLKVCCCVGGICWLLISPANLLSIHSKMSKS